MFTWTPAEAQDGLHTFGDDSRIFVVQPSLEGVLGISRKAKDKPKRIVAALRERNLDDVPTVVRSAVEALFAEG